MNHKKVKHYLVVDENIKPMTFQFYGKTGLKGQFVYSNISDLRSPIITELYTLESANNLINISNDWRRKRGFSADKFKLIPVKAPNS